MRWKIDPAKPFTEEIRAIGGELISGAEKGLALQERGPHEAVHGARKKFKRIRALYRLVQPDAPEFRKHENLRFQTIARSLSDARDAAALVENVEWMAQSPRSAAEADALLFARQALEERREQIVAGDTGLPQTIENARQECALAQKALLALDVPDGRRATAKRVALVWSRQHRVAREALEMCRSQADDEHFHELRKSSQIRWMHLGLLGGLWPCAMRLMQEDTRKLVELLGHEHDLSVLGAFADAQPALFGNGETLARLLGAIIERKQLLRRESLELASRVFEGSPKEEGRRIRLLWHFASREP